MSEVVEAEDLQGVLKVAFDTSASQIRTIRTAFRKLLANQYRQRKILRRLGDEDSLRYVSRNIRILSAIDNGMGRFTVLSLDEGDGEDLPSQLEMDVVQNLNDAVQESGVSNEGPVREQDESGE